MEISIGICAYNEEQNIGYLLESLLIQKTKIAKIQEIIVISSGSTDRTNDIVRQYSQKDKRIVLIDQKERNGKPAAVNSWLERARGEICVMASADVVLLDNTVENLVMPLTDPKVGFVGSHPVPVNSNSTFMGYMVNLFWELHHQMALRHAKGGEMVAFRNVFPEILNTASDEANIEAIMEQKGYELRYAANAIIRNKGPENISEYIKQRRRQNVGRIHLKKVLGYETATMNNFLVLKTLLTHEKTTFKSIIWLPCCLSVEFYTRMLALYDWHIKKDKHIKWSMVTTTKRLVLDEQSNT